MGVNLSKGGNVSLTKAVPGLSNVVIGLGWDVRKTDGQPFDLDASAFLLDGGERVPSDKHFVFYNEPRSPDGTVVYAGDNKTGAGEGDDETIRIDLTAVPANIHKIAIAVTIHDAETRRQNFGQVGNAYARCLDASNNSEIARFDLSEDGATETALIFCEVYRGSADGEWKLRAVGSGYQGGLAALARNFGVNV